jgi:hypothetical protein
MAERSMGLIGVCHISGFNRYFSIRKLGLIPW